jgi:hypothetical protein
MINTTVLTFPGRAQHWCELYTHGQDGPTLDLSHINTITLKFKHSYQPCSIHGFKIPYHRQRFQIDHNAFDSVINIVFLIHMLNPYFPLDNVQTSHLHGTSYALLSHNSEHTSNHIQYTSNVFLPCVLSYG